MPKQEPTLEEKGARKVAFHYLEPFEDSSAKLIFYRIRKLHTFENSKNSKPLTINVQSILFKRKATTKKREEEAKSRQYLLS